MAILETDSFGQTTQTSGNWNDPTIWSGGAVPAASGTVTVSNPVTIDGNLSPTGNWTFGSNATDQPGGAAYTFNPNAGSNTITIDANEVVSFEGGTSGSPNVFSSGTIDIYGTLILGYTQMNNSGSLNVKVETGGTLVIIGDLTNKNNTGTFTINGALIVNGDFDASTGSVTVGGTGTINTTGKLTSTGGSTIFGTTNDCNTGPCSGGSLRCSFSNRIFPMGKVICTGNTAGTLTSSTTAGSPVYQWMVSTDNVTYSNAPGISNASSYVTPALTQTTWYKLKIVAGGCTSYSPESKVTVASGAGWVGGTSTDWATAANWCSLTVPTSTTDVTITNTGSNFMPRILAGTSAAARSVTISNTYPQSSLTVTASGTASISIYGDINNNGVFTDSSTAASAGVILAGSVAQNISSVSALAVNNLTISKGGSTIASINNNLTVSNNLTMTSGLVNLGGGTVTLGVSAASPGALAYSPGSWFYGGNVVRWLPSSTALAPGSSASLFPIGGDASNYRPMYFGSSGLTAGGTIRVSHTALNGAVPVSFSDGGSAIQVRSTSYWTVATGNGIAGTGISVRAEGTGFGIVGNTSDLRLTLASSAAPGTAGVNAGTLMNPQVNRTGLSAGNLSNNFYWGSINPGFTTLPAELLSFAGVAQSGKVVLNWTVAEASAFAVERSSDGVNFVEIGKVLAGDGFGYTYTDERPFVGNNYYRLRIVDQAGVTSYSRVIAVDLGGNYDLVLFPNPSDGRSVTARIGGIGQASYSIDVFDDQGRKVGHGYSADAVQTIFFMPVLPQGLYFARVLSMKGSIVRMFVVKR
ncbi:MAG: T9SS type A sorting domain-containing protein [Bacteroidetes bacterium]|nr:T9SS type A sorting domain-containing protein [Bacteroidota bacterium]